MQADDRQKFAVLMTGIAEMYEKELTKPALRLWWQCLEKFDIEDVTRAIEFHVQHPDHGQFMPKPADIIRQIEGGGDERSLGAWTKVMSAISRVGSWKPLVFDDSRIHAVIAEMGGWMRFASVTDEEAPFLRNEFCTRYRSYLQKPPVNYPAMILGEGGFSERPVMIGNEELAKHVMLAGGDSEQSKPTHALAALGRPH